MNIDEHIRYSTSTGRHPYSFEGVIQQKTFDILVYPSYFASFDYISQMVFRHISLV